MYEQSLSVIDDQKKAIDHFQILVGNFQIIIDNNHIIEAKHQQANELQSQKIKTNTVMEGIECGLMVESKVEMVPGDIVEAITVEKLRI